MGCLLQSIWVVLGYALASNQLICMLVDCQERLECYCVENGAFMPHVVSME
jgi:hypothetical protein